MKRILTATAALSLIAALPAGAEAKPKPAKPSGKAKIFRASLSGLSGTDWDYSGLSGRVQLVDGKKVDHLTIKVKGLQAGHTYTWDLHEADPADPCGTHAGAAVADFKYRTLKANGAGNASSKATAKVKKGQPGFSVGTGTYAVTVHHPQTGEVVLCGVIKPKAKKKSPKGKGKGKGTGGGTPRPSHQRPAPKAPKKP